MIMMKTSVFRPVRPGLVHESFAGIPAWLILVLRHRRGESNPSRHMGPLFDDIGFGKVSFPAQLSVK
jgi:hypothetical protein